MGKNYSSDTMGRFEFLPGMERGGSPVYRQSHSNKVPSGLDFLLYRWESTLLGELVKNLSFSGDFVPTGWGSDLFRFPNPLGKWV